MSLFGQLPMFKQRRDRPKVQRPPLFVALASMYVAGERVEVELPLRLVSLPNMRENWSAKARRVKAQRVPTHTALRGPVASARLIGQRVTVTIARIAPCALDDDNLRGACKAVRDGVADALALKSDRDPLVRWEYEQEKRAPRTYGVRILIEVAR